MKNVLTAVLAVSLAGCGMLEAEAETNRLCVEQTNAGAAIDAGPGEPIQGAFTLPQLQLDMGAAVPDLDEEGVEVDIHPEAITLGSVAGTADLSGVETLTLTIPPPDSRPDLPPAVFRYERPTPAPASVFELRATPTTAVDLADYIQGNVLRIQAAGTLNGRAPQQSWTPTLETCGETRVKIDYWERITG
jgi:hypothetical protein